MADSINTSVIRGPGMLGPDTYMPSEQYMRSIDTYPRLQEGAGGSPVDFSPPLWLTQVDSTNVIVAFGTVNGFTPTNVASNISISSDATWNIYLDATVSATTGAVSAVTITASTSAIPADTSTHSYRRIGTVVRASGSITSVSPALAWSQEFVACTGGDTATYHWVVA